MGNVTKDKQAYARGGKRKRARNERIVGEEIRNKQELNERVWG